MSRDPGTGRGQNEKPEASHDARPRPRGLTSLMRLVGFSCGHATRGLYFGEGFRMIEIFKFLVPTLFVPLGVFAGNWALRYKSGYAQTAASDFLLAVIIFDFVAVITASDIEPFVRAPELRTIVVQWHVFILLISCFLWWLIATFGEPKLAHYYEREKIPEWPIVTFSLCWMGVLALMCLHIGFFLMNVNSST
jgi:hypothetical protein